MTCSYYFKAKISTFLNVFCLQSFKCSLCWAFLDTLAWKICCHFNFSRIHFKSFIDEACKWVKIHINKWMNEWLNKWLFHQILVFTSYFFWTFSSTYLLTNRAIWAMQAIYTFLLLIVRSLVVCFINERQMT